MTQGGTYAIVTFGCRVNQADSLALEGELRQRGSRAAPPEEADLLIVNTCSVTASAEQGARQIVRRVVRRNPSVRVIVTGCYATRAPADLRSLPNVTEVIGNGDKDRLAAIVMPDVADGMCGRPLEPGVAGRTALSLRVQTGCEESCSYCIIPTTRGASRSKTIADVLTEIGRAIDAGYKEFWITGVHLGSFGRDGRAGENLEQLVTQLARVESDVLFRISSLEPMDCTPAVVDCIAASPRLAPHLHLPLQHASDEMLAAMRRPYRRSSYVELISRVHRLMPHASIGTDVIVGFPGEEDRHFAELRDLLAELPLAYVHVFPYSDRPGTRASGLTAKVDGTLIRQRGAELREIGADKARTFRRSQAGSVRRALTVDDGRSAVTDNYLKVKVAGRLPRNQWIDAMIGAAD